MRLWTLLLWRKTGRFADFEGMNLSRRILAALALGYVLNFWSELMFWAPPPFYNPLDPVITWLSYSVLGYMGLSAVAVFRVRDAAAALLVAALMGWLAEGVLAQAMYRDFPVGLAREALGWHALVSVYVGVGGVTFALSTRRRWVLTASSVALGLFWGLWAVAWWSERLPVSLAAFAAYATLSTGLLIAAHWTLGRLDLADFRPTPAECRTLSFVTGAYFLLVTVPAAPAAIVVAPVVFGLTVWALHRNRGRDARDADLTVLTIFERRVPAERYPALALAPLTAVVVYAAAEAMDLTIPLRQPLLLLLAAMGAAAYVGSVGWVIWRTWQPGIAAKSAGNAANPPLPA